MNTKWADFPTWKIHIENNDDFNSILGKKWEKAIKDFNVIDIGFSDRCLTFDNEENRDWFEAMLIMNHIKIKNI